jgi:glycerophosphoryl diester phosphodiesterase
MAAFRLALDQGCDGVEFDVQLSKDGVPVVIHDTTLKRTGGRDVEVASLSADELASTDVGSWFNRSHPQRADGRYSAETVPVLDNLLEYLWRSEAIIYLELKCDDRNFRELTTAVCSRLRSASYLQRVIVKSFSLEAIACVRAELPEVQTALLMQPTTRTLLRPRDHPVTLAVKLGAHRLSLHWSLVTKRTAQASADAGLPITLWTVNTPRWIRKARELGVDTLITNDPGLLIRERDER